MENENHIFAEIIAVLHERRISKEISIRRLSKLCGMARSTISRMERGLSSPKFLTISKIVLALGMTMDLYLLPQEEREI